MQNSLANTVTARMWSSPKVDTAAARAVSVRQAQTSDDATFKLRTRCGNRGTQARTGWKHTLERSSNFLCRTLCLESIFYPTAVVLEIQQRARFEITAR